VFLFQIAETISFFFSLKYLRTPFAPRFPAFPALLTGARNGGGMAMKRIPEENGPHNSSETKRNPQT
jgi:hypothetical protein